VAALASIVIGVLTVNILVANNLRDRALDEQVGKRTLSVRLGEERTRRLFAVTNMCAFVLVAWLAISTTAWALLAMAGAIPAVKASQDVLEHAYGRGLIPVLQMSSLALLLTGVGLGAGLAL
jgi:1,4-dihydroxy-2-naphthoate octaprenyltransferase